MQVRKQQLELDMVDYIMFSQIWRNTIESPNTRPGADCGSDHEQWEKTLDHSVMT